MPEVIFIKMLGNGGKIRESYSDLYHMVDLWGYKTCLLNEVDYQSENIYVCTFKDGAADSSFSSAEAKARKCKIVLWHIEWPEWRNGNLEWPEWAGEKYNVMWEFLWADEIWVSDLHVYDLIRKFNPKNFHRTRYVFLGGHPDFGDKDYQNREILFDAVHIAYITGTRGVKCEIMSQFMKIAPAGWGEQRHFALTHSRWGVQLHQNPLPCITPQRFMIFASYCLPILTDYVARPEPYIVFQDGLIHWQPQHTSVSNKELREAAIQHNYELVTQKQTFRSEVDKAVAQMLGAF